MPMRGVPLSHMFKIRNIALIRCSCTRHFRLKLSQKILEDDMRNDIGAPFTLTRLVRKVCVQIIM